MARFRGNGDTGRGGSRVGKLARAAIAVGLVASVAFVGCALSPYGRDAGVRSVDRDVIPNHYLVVVRPQGRKAGVRSFRRAIDDRNDLLRQVNRDQVSGIYSRALVGFSAVMTPKKAKAFQDDPRAEVFQSKRMRLAATPTRPPFGLDRLGQRLLPFDRNYSSNLTGEGVHVYVVDTGILTSNPQFAGRIGAGRDFINDGKKDCEGHGTHVAGTIGATTYGIAKKVTLHPVRVVGCSHLTDTDHVISGLNWIIATATAPAIVNMSLSGPSYPALDAVVKRGIQKGLIFIVAAGNVDDDHTNRDACRTSPARVRAAITVGAMDPGKDRIAPFSFHGGCVDLFAPGVNILSARNDSQNYGALMDGTSMAAAHASGVAALYLDVCKRRGIETSPEDVWKALNVVAGVPGVGNWKGLIKHPWDSHNKLLYWGSVVQPAAGSASLFPWWRSKPRCLRSSSST